MGRLRSIVGGVVVITLAFSAGSRTVGLGAPTLTARQDPRAVTVALRAASGATVAFWTQNRTTVNGAPPRMTNLPLLVLYRNGALTGPDERTLIVEVGSIRVPPGGVTVTLSIVTERVNPDRRDVTVGRILVDRQAQRIAGGMLTSPANGKASFTRVFTEDVTWSEEGIPTPTDYLRVEVSVDDGTIGVRPQQELGLDYAFLMENQWIVGLPDVGEESPGAAPDELIVHYRDMVPFERDVRDPATRLRRGDVPEFVGQELVPHLVEAFRLQTDTWGFPWPAGWTSFRPEDGESRLSVALTDGNTWYHGRAPMTGDAMISLNVSGRASQHYLEYDALIDALMSIFHHELFHNLQRAVHQAQGGDGDLGLLPDVWKFFSEGTAVLASSVAQPWVHFGAGAAGRHYVESANLFPARNVHDYDVLSSTPSLDDYGAPDSASDRSPAEQTSYETMPSPAAAMYWRFLYERCGGMRDGVEDPGAGMEVIHRALIALYSADIVDPARSTDLVENLPAIMDRALAGSLCPFQTFEDSLVHLSRAIYALRLDLGRCLVPGLLTGCGLYDPHGLYADPPVSAVAYFGADQRVPVAIPSSFGMAFVDILIEPVADGRSLTIEFAGAPGAEAEFRVQVWRLIDPRPDRRPRPARALTADPEVLQARDPNGRLVVTIPAIDLAEFNRMGLIITRVDARESSDPMGEYTIWLRCDCPSNGR